MRLIFILLFISNFIYTQEDSRTWIRGKVLYKNSNVISANVVNNTSREATITDNDGELSKADVVGPVCESSDFFAKDCELPMLEHNDLLVVHSAGAPV